MSVFAYLQRELLAFKLHPVEGFSAGPVNGNDMLHWEAVFTGPSQTPYEGGIFSLDIWFPLDYPYKPPSVRFRTKVYHCNVGEDGHIGLDILTDQWKPSLGLEKLLLSISSLLADPNPNIPMMEDAADLYKFYRVEHDRVAKEWTAKYAT